MLDTTTISNFIEQQFPEIYREEGPFFIEFLRQYYIWMEIDSQSPVYQARRHLSNLDIDTTVDDFVIYFKEKYLKNIQLNTATNTKQLVKNALDLYRSKGSTNSIKLFFDLIFSADSSVYYPGTDVFRASDAQWSIPYYLEVTPKTINRLFVGQAIQGVNSGATGFVEKLVRRKIKNYFVEIFYISAVTGTFQTGEIIQITQNSTLPVDECPSIVGSLTTLDILDGGTGFSKGDLVDLESRTGADGKGLVTSLETLTGLVNYTLVDGGWGYSSNANIFVSEKVLNLANVHIVSSSNTSLAGDVINIYQPTANVQWYNNTAFFGVGETVYNYYANGALIGQNQIISAEYGTNTTTNYFLLNNVSGNNYMDPAQPYYYTAGNTDSFQVQNAGWTDNTANAEIIGMSANVILYCAGNTSSFSVNDTAYQVSTNNAIFASANVINISITSSNTFSITVSDLDGLFLTNQPLVSRGTNNSVSILSASYDVGIRLINGTFSTANGNIIYDTSTGSMWNASVMRSSFGDGANTGFSSDLLFPETVSLNTNYVNNHIDDSNPENWINATSYGSDLNFANLTNMTLANALTWESMTIGKIARLQNQNPGLGYTSNPIVEAIDPLVAPLHKQDFVLRYTSTTGVFQIGESVTQSVSGAQGIVKFANTTEMHVSRLTFADRWVAGNTDTTYLVVGTSSGHQTYLTEVTYDIDGIAGENAIITTSVISSNSTISGLKVVDSGFSFADGDFVTFTSSDKLRSGTAIAHVLTTGHGSGFYKTTSGFLSSNKYLYDGYYYQDFSYEIRSPVTVSSYSDMLKNVLHVAGTKFFSALVKKTNIDSSTGVISSNKHQGIPGILTSPTISGSASVGSTISTSNGVWTNSPSSYAYQWRVGKTDVLGATSQTYVIQSTDLAKTIRCTVRATNSIGTGSAMTPTVTVIAQAPLVTVPPVATGTAAVGQILTVSNGTWTSAPTSYTYQWQRGGSPISGATSSTYTVTSLDVGDVITCLVTALNSQGSSYALSNGIGPIPSSGTAPINTIVPAISGTNQEGNTLTTTNGTWLNSPTSYSYQWKRNGVVIASATSSTYLLVSVDVDKTITCDITATNGAGSTVATTASVGPIASGAPSNTSAPSVSGTALQGQTLTTTNGTWTNSPTSYTYQWLRNGATIGGANSSTYVLSSSDVSANISCTVIATNAYGSNSSTSSTIGPVASAAPSLTLAPSISGTTQQGSTLTTTNGTWTNSPTYSYQWKRNGTAISGATASTYVLVSGDVGFNITCTVTATNAYGSGSATTASVGPITTGVPANVSAPSVSGTTQQGSTLTTTNGTWTNSPTSYTYQWKRSGTNISGATSSTYVLVSGDVGFNISCVVTATNSFGSTSATSSTVGPITSGIPSNTTPPSISGAPEQNQTLTVSNGVWTNSPTSYTYQWLRDGTTISSATASTYVLSSSDVGTNISCAVTAVNTSGSATVTTASIGPVAAYAPDLSAPILGYPSAANPPSMTVSIGDDWQEGDVFVLSRSSSTTMSSPTVITHTLLDSEITAKSFSVIMGSLSGTVYFQAHGQHSGLDSSLLSNIVAWGDTTAPVFTSANNTTIVETIPLLWQFTFSTNDIAEVDVYTGADQLQFETFFNSGSWYARGLNNKAWHDNAREDQGLDGVYNVTFIATDYAGNQTTQDFAMTVQAADLDPTHYTFTPQSNVAKSTTYSPIESPITVSGLSSGVNASASINIGEYNKNNTGWVSAGSFTVQNGDTVGIRQTSSSSFLTGTTQTLTIGTYSANFIVTTLADPSAASFSPSATQPLPQTKSNNSNVVTWTGTDFAAGYPIVFCGSPPGGRTILSVTVNGVTLTNRTPGASGNGGVWVGTSTVTAGNYNIVVTYSNVVTWVGIMTGTLINTTNPVPTGTVEGGFSFSNSLSSTTALTIPSEGVGIAFFEESSETDSPTATSGTLVGTGLYNMASSTNGDTPHNNYNGAISRQVASGSWTPGFTFPGLANYVHLLGLSFAAS